MASELILELLFPYCAAREGLSFRRVSRHLSTQRLAGALQTGEDVRRARVIVRAWRAASKTRRVNSWLSKHVRTDDTPILIF
jgi:hypothetical protein